MVDPRQQFLTMMRERLALRLCAANNQGVETLRIDPDLLELLRSRLPEVAALTVGAIVEEVPAYRVPFGGPMGRTIEQAVEVALAGFLHLAARGRSLDDLTPRSPALDGATTLGRQEARTGRSADALLAAYRVGARVAWREMAATSVEHGVDGRTMAAFAELVFDYIDRLSAASVRGHQEERESSDRARDRHRELLVRRLLRGDPHDAVLDAARRAEVEPPEGLVALLVPDDLVAGVVPSDGSVLVGPGDVPELPDGTTVLLLPCAAERDRVRWARSLADRPVVLGPRRPWAQVGGSYRRALLALRTSPPRDALYDTEAHLADLLLGTDSELVADLRAQVLAPLADLTDASREKLEETLREWLLRQGRREEVAEAVFVHPQTVRYRMGQVRELYGDRLTRPDVVRDLVIALSAAPHGEAPDD